MDQLADLYGEARTSYRKFGTHASKYASMQASNGERARQKKKKKEKKKQCKNR
jgi:hypothetical protein